MNRKLGKKIKQPEETPYMTADNEVRRCNDYPFKIGFGKYTLCTYLDGKDGLWKVNKNEVIKIKDGIINFPFITPNPKWIIYGKAKEDLRNLYYLHYLNTETNEEFKVNLPPADFIGAVVYVEAHKKVLITRYQIEGRNRKNNPSPEKPVFYLLDLKTGKAEEKKGEFRPLMQLDYRFLQSTKKNNEFWATIPDWKNNKFTRFGLYNIKDFTFTQIIKFNDITFASNDMWVDEKERRIYVVYDGHLLSLPLPKV